MLLLEKDGTRIFDGGSVRAEDLILTTLRDQSAFEELESEWSLLLEQSEANNVFLSWDWVRVWWVVYGEPYELYLMEVRDEDGTLVAIAPLKIARGPFGRRTAEFMGQGGGVTPEYLDFLVRRGWAQIALPAILHHLASDPYITDLDLHPIPDDSPNLPLIRRTLAEAGVLRTSARSKCPVISLPETWEQYLASKSKNYRKKMREFENRANRDLRAEFRLTRTVEDLDADLATLRALHQSRWDGKSRAFSDARYMDFHRDFARCLLTRNQLRLYTLETQGKPIASLYCFRHEHTIYYYQSGRDPGYGKYRVGLLIIHWAIREAIREGATLFDLLTGAEHYKQRWATSYRTNLRIRFRHRLSRRLASLLGLQKTSGGDESKCKRGHDPKVIKCVT